MTTRSVDPPFISIPRARSRNGTMPKYDGYTAYVEFDNKAGIFHGEVLDLRDVITFQGKSVEEIKKAFSESMDDYLEFCKERNEEDEKSSE